MKFLQLSDGMFLNFDNVLAIEESHKIENAGNLCWEVRVLNRIYSEREAEKFVLVVFSNHNLILYNKDAEILSAYLDQWRG